MQIVPVIDIRNKQVVRGIAGRRNEYRPLQSQITDSTDPLTVAADLRETFGLKTLYVADLDGILDQRPHLDLYAELSKQGHTTWVDAGIRSVEDAAAVIETGIDTAIVGLESCPSPQLLLDLVQRFGPERLLFSLDLRAGVPMLPADWPRMKPLEIAETAIAAGFRRLLVLDLADVGTNAGGSTDHLIRAIRSQASITLIAGGGIRNSGDIQRLGELGVSEVLVASALHNGWLTRDDILRIHLSGGREPPDCVRNAD